MFRLLFHLLCAIAVLSVSGARQAVAGEVQGVAQCAFEAGHSEGKEHKQSPASQPELPQEKSIEEAGSPSEGLSGGQSFVVRPGFVLLSTLREWAFAVSEGFHDEAFMPPRAA